MGLKIDHSSPLSPELQHVLYGVGFLGSAVTFYVVSVIARELRYLRRLKNEASEIALRAITQPYGGPK